MVKRYIVVLIILALIFNVSCGKEEEKKNNDTNKKQVKTIDTKSANEFIDNYLRFVLNADMNAMKSYYSKKMQGEVKDVKTIANPRPISYKVEGGEKKEDKVEVKVHIYNGFDGTPYFADKTFKYTVIKEDGHLAIDKIEEDKSIVIEEKEKSLYKREGYKIKGDPIVKLDDLPDYVTPKKGSSPEREFPVPKKGFGPCALSPDGKKILISSIDKDSFLAVAEMEGETEAFVAMEEDKQKQGGEGEEKKEEKGNAAEGKANIILKPIDFYFGSKINIVNFSPDGKKFLTEFTKSSGIRRIMIYSSDSNDIMETSIDKRLKEDVFNIKDTYFTTPEQIIFKVEATKNANDEEKKLNGIWSYDIKEDKLKQVQ